MPIASRVHQHQFDSHSYAAPNAGPSLIITGAVHGNEICGTQAIRRLIEEIENNQIQLIAGNLTLVPVTNPMAYQLERRHGERNLNRRLRPTEQVLEFEDHVANWLCPLLAQHEVLLDLHSFQGSGQAFVMLGPENNVGAIEPFTYAEQEHALALSLGVHRFVDGWLATYALGVERRRQQSLAVDGGASSRDADRQFGVGTTEYMRSVGGYALTLECGQHRDPRAPEIAYQAILNALKQLGMLAGEKPQAVRPREALRLCEVVDKVSLDDQFSRPWESFDAIKNGQLIGLRADGSEVLAGFDGWIIFPDANALAGEEWFYLAQHNPRF
jgi:predicted deacylase